MKINFETGCIKKLLVGLVSSFQPLTNFTKNPNDAMVVLNALLIYSNTIMYLPFNTIMYSRICAVDQIKYRRTVACNFKIMNS